MFFSMKHPLHSSPIKSVNPTSLVKSAPTPYVNLHIRNLHFSCQLSPFPPQSTYSATVTTPIADEAALTARADRRSFVAFFNYLTTTFIWVLNNLLSSKNISVDFPFSFQNPNSFGLSKPQHTLIVNNERLFIALSSLWVIYKSSWP